MIKTPFTQRLDRWIKVNECGAPLTRLLVHPEDFKNKNAEKLNYHYRGLPIQAMGSE